MENTLGPDEVLRRINKMRTAGGSLSKKYVKQHDPELMKNALFYFPSWDHALKNAEDL